jgi:hypothetical protein
LTTGNVAPRHQTGRTLARAGPDFESLRQMAKPSTIAVLSDVLGSSHAASHQRRLIVSLTSLK